MAYKMKMYDPSGKLVEVNRNQQDELLGQGYSFMGPKTTTANTGATTYNAPSQQTLDSTLGAMKAATSVANSIAGAFGGGMPSGLMQVQNNAMTNAFNQLTQPSTTMQQNPYDTLPQVEQVPKINPIDDIMAEYRDQINALATETDPGYNENLEQISPEDMEEEIL